MTKKNGRAEEPFMNKQLEALIKSGEIVVHPRTASKAALKRAAKGQFRTIRLKKGVRIARSAKLLH